MSNSEVHSGISQNTQNTENDNFVLAQIFYRTIRYCARSWSRLPSAATRKMATATTARCVPQDPPHQAMTLIPRAAALTGRESAQHCRGVAGTQTLGWISSIHAFC